MSTAPHKPAPLFVAVKAVIMRGPEHIATACSRNMALRIAHALNKYRPNREGR